MNTMQISSSENSDISLSDKSSEKKFETFSKVISRYVHIYKAVLLSTEDGSTEQ